MTDFAISRNNVSSFRLLINILLYHGKAGDLNPYCRPSCCYCHCNTKEKKSAADGSKAFWITYLPLMPGSHGKILKLSADFQNL